MQLVYPRPGAVAVHLPQPSKAGITEGFRAKGLKEVASARRPGFDAIASVREHCAAQERQPTRRSAGLSLEPPKSHVIVHGLRVTALPDPMVQVIGLPEVLAGHRHVVARSRQAHRCPHGTSRDPRRRRSLPRVRGGVRDYRNNTG